MPFYSYIAKSYTGKEKRGTLEAKTEQDLARMLRRDGYILISASLPEEKAKKKKFSFSFSFSAVRSVSLVEKIMFTRNLRVMVASGISLPRAIKILSGQSKSRKLKKALLNISEELIKGKNFSDSLARHSDIFPELYFSMIRVGEEAGTLEEVLGVLIFQMERDHDIKSKIKSALIYPSVIIAAMLGIGILMLVLVVPRLAETFAELGIDLPLTTRIVVAIGTLLSRFWYLMPVLLIFAVFLGRLLLKTSVGKKIFNTLVLKIPIISPIVIKTNSAYTVRTLSSLISAGVPIVRALEVVAGSLVNIHYKKAISRAAEEVKKGIKLAASLKGQEKIYPSLVIQMIEIGEETGETSKILEKLAEFFEEEVTRTTKNLSSVIEPVLMLLIGAAVGFFAISMLQPIYSMLSAFQ